MMDVISSFIDLKQAITLGFPALVVIVGWFVVHWQNSRRELTNRRRDARLEKLESAFLCLALSAHRVWTDENKKLFEKFVAEIQLYGTPRQVELTSQIIDGFTRKFDVVSFDDLLLDLRATLRQELRMEPINDPIWWYRFKLPKVSRKYLERESVLESNNETEDLRANSRQKI